MKPRILSNPLASLSAAFIGILVVLMLAAPSLGLPDPNDHELRDRLLPPLSTGDRTGTLHVLGTDQFGRDLLSRTLAGGLTSLSVALPAALIALFVGSGLGMAGAFRRGLLDAVVQRMVEIQLAFPFVLMGLLLVAVAGRSVPTLIVAFSISTWALFARTSRSEALLVRNLPYVESARAIGCSKKRIFLTHIVPNSATSALVLFSLTIASIMVTEASLSFLGLGVPPEQPSWGSIIADGRDYLASAWWISAEPGFLLLLVVLAIVTIGERFRGSVDPLMATRRN